MSGGVDSAVAAARAVDAGHDVVGRAPGAVRDPGRAARRVARLLLPGGRRRRPAGRRRAGHPVLRVGLRRPVHRRRGRRLRRRLRRRADPEPVPAVQREDQVLGAAGPGARARLRRGLHRALRAADRDAGGRPSCGGPSTRTRTSPTCSPCSPPRSWRTPCSRSATPRKPAVRAEAAARGLRVADKPDSHDICFIPSGDTRAFLGRPARGAAGPGRRRTRPGASWPGTTACTGSPSASARGSGVDAPAADGRPRYVLGIEPASGTVRVGPAAALDVEAIDGDPAGVEQRAPSGRRRFRCVAQVRAHGGLAPATGRAGRATACGVRARRAAARGGPRPGRRPLPPRRRRRRGAGQRHDHRAPARRVSSRCPTYGAVRRERRGRRPGTRWCARSAGSGWSPTAWCTCCWPGCWCRWRSATRSGSTRRARCRRSPRPRPGVVLLWIIVDRPGRAGRLAARRGDLGPHGLPHGPPRAAHGDQPGRGRAVRGAGLVGGVDRRGRRHAERQKSFATIVFELPGGRWLVALAGWSWSSARATRCAAG